MPAGYVRAWLSMEAAIDHIMRIAGCGRQEARDALVLAITDGEVRSRFCDDGIQEIPPSEWQSARRFAPIRGPNGKLVRGGPLRPFFDPPPEPETLPECLRPVEVRRDDLERLWPSLSVLAEPSGPLPRAAAETEASDTDERLARKWRRQRIAKFAERQRTVRRWMAVTDLANWCAHSTTTANLEAEAQAREVAYQRLTESMRGGEFERDGRSKVLYLDTLVTSDGSSPRCRLTREQLEIAAPPPAPSVPITVLNCCWLPVEIARDWLQVHGYRLPQHLVPLAEQSAWPSAPTAKIHAAKGSALQSAVRKAADVLGKPGRDVPWGEFCRRVRSDCNVSEKDPPRGYGDKSIERAFKAIEPY